MPRLNIPLRAATAALVMLSYLALATAARYTGAILLLPLAALLIMPAAEWLDRRTPLYRTLSSSLTVFVSIGLLFLVPVSGLLDSVTFLVVYVQLYSLLHVKEERNYDHIILMSFFLVLAATVMSPSPAIGIVFALFTLAAVWMLILLEMLAAAQKGSATGLIRKPLHGAVTRLVALPPNRPIDARLAVWIAACGLLVIVMTSSIFFASPRLEAGLLGASDPTVFNPGVSAEVNLSLGGLIGMDTSAVMQVVFPDEPEGRYTGEMYWRNTALDHYTGTGWMRRGLGPGIRATDPYRRYVGTSSVLGWVEGYSVDRQPFGRGRLVKQEIFLAEAPETGLPSLNLVKSIRPEQGQGNMQLRWDRAGDFTVKVTGRARPGLSYTAVSEVPEYTPAELRNASENYGKALHRRDYRRLTGHNLLPQTRRLVQDITKSAETAYDKALAIEDYLVGGTFSYTTDVPTLAGKNPVDAFIHVTKTGHCELYASAMALMLRSQGIPTRVVNGYRGGEWDEGSQSYTVTANTAHLWVEVFFPTIGWVPFDPSPPAPELNPFSLSGIRRLASMMALRAKVLWYRKVVGFRPGSRMDILRDVSWGLFRIGADPRERAGGIVAQISLMERMRRLLSLPVLAGGVAFLAYNAVRRRRKRHENMENLTEDQRRAIELHRRLTRKLRRLGVDCEAKTVGEIRNAIQAHPLEDREPALMALGAYNAVRFGQRPLSREVLAMLRRAIGELRPAVS